MRSVAVAVAVGAVGAFGAVIPTTASTAIGTAPPRCTGMPTETSTEVWYETFPDPELDSINVGIDLTTPTPTPTNRDDVVLSTGVPNDVAKEDTLAALPEPTQTPTSSGDFSIASLPEITATSIQPSVLLRRHLRRLRRSIDTDNDESEWCSYPLAFMNGADPSPDNTSIYRDRTSAAPAAPLAQKPTTTAQPAPAAVAATNATPVAASSEAPVANVPGTPVFAEPHPDGVVQTGSGVSASSSGSSGGSSGSSGSSGVASLGGAGSVSSSNPGAAAQDASSSSPSSQGSVPNSASSADGGGGADGTAGSGSHAQTPSSESGSNSSPGSGGAVGGSSTTTDASGRPLVSAAGGSSGGAGDREESTGQAALSDSSSAVRPAWTAFSVVASVLAGVAAAFC